MDKKADVKAKVDEKTKVDVKVKVDKKTKNKENDKTGKLRFLIDKNAARLNQNDPLISNNPAKKIAKVKKVDKKA